LETIVNIEDPSRRSALYGPADRYLRLIRAAFDVRISARNGVLRISGPAEAVAKAAHCLQQLQRALRTCPSLSDDQVKEVIHETRASEDLPQAVSEISVYLPSAHITPKGDGQRTYVEAIRNHDLTFCLGPAGTGKTYLAVAMAVSLLKNNKIKRIVLVRPAVEAGEKLGYLPGDMQAKVNPYLRPLFDAMHDMMTFDQIKRFMQNDVIEVIPLAFMRGRTLNHSAIILDEAQNATPMQMLMFLTRLGHHSKMIVTGDDSQSDLGAAEKSGVVDAVARLRDVKGVAVLRLTRWDIVRHPLVQKVVEVYGDKTGGPPSPSDKS
jgi:phosphate starvation-inducible PhoH-like protein